MKVNYDKNECVCVKTYTFDETSGKCYLDCSKFHMIKNEETGKCECPKGTYFDYLERKCLKI